MAYFSYFSFGENLDFPDFLQNSFITSTTGIQWSFPPPPTLSVLWWRCVNKMFTAELNNYWFFFLPFWPGVCLLSAASKCWSRRRAPNMTSQFFCYLHYLPAVWPDWVIYWTLGNFLKSLAAINLSKSPTLLGNFCNGVKIYHFSSKIIFRKF